MKEKRSAARVLIEEVKEVKGEPTAVTPSPISSPPFAPTPPPPPPSINLLWVIIPGMILLGLLMGGVVAYYTGMQKLASGEKGITTRVSPSAVASPTPSATPSAKIDLTKYKIKVLNGSGIKGEAGRAKDLLEKVGFVVEGIGNAKTYDYQKTIIQTKKSVEESFLAKLKESLGKTYELAKNETLADSETSAVIIIIGSSKAK